MQEEVAIEPLIQPPALIADAPGLQVWHKLDTTFGLPKAIACLKITSNAAYESARAAAATHLALKLLEDVLCETSYLADVAGLSYDVRLCLPVRSFLAVLTAIRCLFKCVHGMLHHIRQR